MKQQAFKHSMLAVGIISALGMSGTALAAPSGGAVTPTPVTTAKTTAVDDTFELKNQASATYQIGGVEQPIVKSNEVVVTVSRQINFTLVDNHPDGKVTPDGKVEFVHTLTNDGNIADEYTIAVDNVTGDSFDFTKFEIKVKKTGESDFTTISGNKITLEPGQAAEIQIVATADDNSKGEKGKITVTATSSKIPASTNGKTQTNTDTATTETPIFAITKAATTSQVKPNGIVSYTINVTNTGNMAATKANIVDALPAELQFAADPKLVVKRNNNVITTGFTSSTASDTLTINDIDIAINDTITITFDTQVKPSTTVGTTIINAATVTDDPDDDPNTDNGITDSSDSGESQDNTNDPNGDTNDNTNPSKVTVVNTDVTINKNESVTLPPTGKNVFTHTISNNSGATKTGLKLNLDPLVDSNHITQTIYLDSNGNGSYDEGSDQAYTAGDDLAAIPTGQSVKIFVVNKSDKAEADDDASTPWKDNTAIIREQYKITLEGTGAAADSKPSVTDTVSIAGLELKKEQAVAACNATPTYSSDAVTGAQPGQCIFYRITATNHLPATNPADIQNITNLVLSDSIQNIGTTVGKVKYRTDAQGTNVSYAEPVVTDNAGTLAGGASKQLTFSVEINK